MVPMIGIRKSHRLHPLTKAVTPDMKLPDTNPQANFIRNQKIDILLFGRGFNVIAAPQHGNKYYLKMSYFQKLHTCVYDTALAYMRGYNYGLLQNQRHWQGTVAYGTIVDTSGYGGCVPVWYQEGAHCGRVGAFVFLPRAAQRPRSWSRTRRLFEAARGHHDCRLQGHRCRATLDPPCRGCRRHQTGSRHQAQLRSHSLSNLHQLSKIIGGYRPLGGCPYPLYRVPVRPYFTAPDTTHCGSTSTDDYSKIIVAERIPAHVE